MADGWRVDPNSGTSAWRMGAASAATTFPGSQPSYGLAYDMSSGQWRDAREFSQFTQDLSGLTQSSAAEAAQQAAAKSWHDQALERAQNLAESMQYGQGGAETNDNDSWWEKQVAAAKSPFIDAYAGAKGLVTGDVFDSHSPEDDYAEYSKKGGLLTEEEFNSFDEHVRIHLLNTVETGEDFRSFAKKPGVSQALTLTNYGYRGLITPFEMAHQAAGNGGPLPLGIANLVDPIWFQKGQWHDAWREAQDHSLGATMLKATLAPYVSEDRLTDWERNNGLFQATAAGSEFVVGWYADPAVYVGKGVGGAARLARNEMPLNETGMVHRAITQNLQREQITVRNPAIKRYADWRAERIRDGQEGVEAYAKAVPEGQFAQLPMFSRRGGAGAPIGHALHYAINSGDDTLKDLAWQTLHGDPKAYAQLNKLRTSTPEELAKFAPGAKTLIDSLDATKTHIAQLEREAADLEKTNSKSPFHDWSVDVEYDAKLLDIEDAQRTLKSYEDYSSFLELLNSTHSPLSQVKAPKRVTENRRLFQNNQYGFAHSFHEIPKAMWIKKATTAAMHDVNSGAVTINRMFDQWEHELHYFNPEARETALQAWAHAETPYDRYKVLYELEETHAVDAFAGKLEVDSGVVRSILEKMHSEQNARKRNVLAGNGSTFNTAPTLAQRVADTNDQSISLVAKNDDGSVTMNMMDGSGHMMTVKVPEEALVERVAPVDPTQTPNYYNPMDTRRVYHELKRDPEMLAMMNADFLERGMAGLMETVDIWGTKFNSLWKPAQLWRLGWPQRVLMDEGMRAMAIFGPMYWITGAGAHAVSDSAKNVLPYINRRFNAHRNGEVSIGQGPERTRQLQDPEPFARARREREAVHVPEEFAFKRNPGRVKKTTEWAAGYGSFLREKNKAKAWHREYTLAAGNGGQHIMDVIAKAQRLGIPMEYLTGDLGAAYAMIPQRHPMALIHQRYQNWVHPGLRGSAGKAKTNGPLVFDATTGQKHNSGFVVPIGTKGFVTKIDPGAPEAEYENLFHWYEKNAEVLGSEGVRLVVGHDGTVTVGRLFTKKSKAVEFLRHVNETVPDTNMWDIGKGHKYYVRDANALSPIAESLYREINGEAEILRNEGMLPADVKKGKGAIHGAYSPLPDELLPRTDVPASTGHRIGEGLYTAVGGAKNVDTPYGVMNRNEGIALGYGDNLYSIRNSKTGKTYKVFDLDRVADYDDFAVWLRANKDRLPDLYDAQFPAEFEAYTMGWFRTAWNDAHAHRYNTRANPNGTTWANFFESLDGTWANVQPHSWYNNGNRHNPIQRALTQYLEEKHNAGALMHKGGAQTGNDYHVYVWLHPEDLELKPLYEKTGRYHPVAEWFDDPRSIENIVPENRIVRTGRRSQAMRELRTLHNQLTEFEKRTDDWANVDSEWEQYETLLDEYSRLAFDLGVRRQRLDNPRTQDRRLSAFRSMISQLDQYAPERFGQIQERAIRENTDRDEAAIANAELRSQEGGVDNDFDKMADFDFDMDSPLSWLKRKIFERREYGSGHSAIEGPSGTEYYRNAFEGHDGQIFKALVSSDPMIDVLSEGHGAALNMMRHQAQGYKPIQPPAMDGKALEVGTPENKLAARYFQRWTDMVNDQIGNSPIWSRMLKGHSDASIVRWLEETPEGAKARKEIMRFGQSPELWVNQHRSALNYYLPNPMLQRLLSKGRLKPSDLRKNVHNDNLPTIYGPDLELLDKRSRAGRLLSNIADKLWNGLGTVPIDALSRHPFAKAMYDMKMRSLVRSTDKKWLDNATIERFQAEAHQYAMGQVKKTLWDLTDATNFTDALRFISPFWGAQQEAILKWLKIIADRPETVARFFVGQRAVYNNFVIVDSDGKPTETNFRKGGLHNLGLYQPEDRVIVPLLPGMDKIPGMKYSGSIGIPIGSANTVLQGEMPLLPGAGPLVTIPADKFMRWTSDTYGVTDEDSFTYRWLFPIGRPKHGGFTGVLEQLSPGYGKRIMSATGGEDDPAKANLLMQVYREMYLEAERKGKQPPTMESAAKQARWLWGLRTVAGMTMPVQTEFRPKNQYYVDKAHQYQREFGTEWWDKFIDDYGKEMAVFATSSSNSTVGIPPSSEGMEEWAGNKEMIRKFPEWGSAIISPDAYKDDFSSDAYYAQFDIALGSGSTENIRNLVSPEERVKKMNENLGWREFRKFQSAVDAELYARGLTNIQQADAADLRQLKEAFIADLTQQNPGWREAYNVHADSIYDRVHELEQFAFDKRFDNRPDMQGARQYLILRDKFTTILDAYHAQTGGSRSLQAAENAPLAQAFYNEVGSLMLANPAFAEFYNRYLDSDTLTMGGGGY